MTPTISPSDLGRRAELLAELFLQELKPRFVAKPEKDLGFDLLAGFRNDAGGTNIVAVEVKSTERDVKSKLHMSRDKLVELARSNIPVLVLVINVKTNAVYWSWAREAAAKTTHGQRATIELYSRANAAARAKLIKHLQGVSSNER